MPKNSQFTPPALPPKKQKINSSNNSLNIILTPPVSPKIPNELYEIKFSEHKTEDDSKEEIKPEPSPKAEESEVETVVLRKKTPDANAQSKSVNLMESLEVADHIVFKKDGDDGQEVLVGGHAEALIIHATKVQKKSEGNENK